MRRRPGSIVGVLVAVALVGCTGGDGDGPVAAPDEDEVAAAEDEADCDVATPGFEGDADHVAPDEAPPAEELYPERPAVGGQHFGEWLEAGSYEAPVDERAAVHNLEHGAVAVYHDPDLPEDEVADIVEWATSRNDAGLLDARSGAGLLVAPWEGPLDPPIAFRAWGVTADCQGFVTPFADGFVREHFGSAGDAPEGSFGGDPTGVVGHADEV